MNTSNAQVLDTLRRVRYRQVPWYKRATLFSSLRELGLIASMRQSSSGRTHQSVVEVAVLTEQGKEELERLELWQQRESWKSWCRVGYRCRAGDRTHDA